MPRSGLNKNIYGDQNLLGRKKALSGRGTLKTLKDCRGKIQLYTNFLEGADEAVLKFVDISTIKAMVKKYHLKELQCIDTLYSMRIGMPVNGPSESIPAQFIKAESKGDEAARQLKNRMTCMKRDHYKQEKFPRASYCSTCSHPKEAEVLTPPSTNPPDKGGMSYGGGDPVYDNLLLEGGVSESDSPSEDYDYLLDDGVSGESGSASEDYDHLLDDCVSDGESGPAPSSFDEDDPALASSHAAGSEDGPESYDEDEDESPQVNVPPFSAAADPPPGHVVIHFPPGKRAGEESEIDILDEADGRQGWKKVCPPRDQ